MRTFSAGVQGQAVWLLGLCSRPLHPTLLLDHEEKGMRWILLERTTAQPDMTVYSLINMHSLTYIE